MNKISVRIAILNISRINIKNSSCYRGYKRTYANLAINIEILDFFFHNM
jgi:hypothetical protein